METLSLQLHAIVGTWAEGASPSALLLAVGAGGLLSWRSLLEILVFFVLFLGLFRIMRGKGIVFVLLGGFFVLQSMVRELQLPRLELVLKAIVETAIIALVIIFQPEL
ncbi:hypothetical protein ACFL59_13820, partial [Planctomycetota bacterium]